MGKTRTPPIQITQKTSRLDNKEPYAFSISQLDNERTIVYAVNRAGLIAVGGLKKLANQSIGTTQTAIPHGLGYTPNIVIIKPKSNAVIWESKDADSTYIYLTASAAATADIYVA